VVAAGWGDNELLRMQLSRKHRKIRLSLIEKPNLTRVERHILTRFKRHYKNNDGKWLQLKTVEEEVKTLFKIPLDQRLKDTVRKMRRKARYEVNKSDRG
jgi:hypothetical protein